MSIPSRRFEPQKSQIKYSINSSDATGNTELSFFVEGVTDVPKYVIHYESSSRNTVTFIKLDQGGEPIYTNTFPLKYPLEGGVTRLYNVVICGNNLSLYELNRDNENHKVFSTSETEIGTLSSLSGRYINWTTEVIAITESDCTVDNNWILITVATVLAVLFLIFLIAGLAMLTVKK